MQIFAFDTVSSTMQVAKDILRDVIQKSDDTVFCVLAKTQTNGIGTQARKWYSPVGNFYATYCFKNVPQELLSKTSLISGISVVQALKNYTIDAGLKWTNDIIINDKKVGGILCDFYDNDLFIGIGLNFKINPVIDDIISLFATDTISNTISDKSLEIDYFEFSKILGDYLNYNLKLLKKNGFNYFINLWGDYSAFYNRYIQVELPNKIVKIGIDKGINHQGCLLIQTQSGIEYFYSARITKVF